MLYTTIVNTHHNNSVVCKTSDIRTHLCYPAELVLANQDHPGVKNKKNTSYAESF